MESLLTDFHALSLSHFPLPHFQRPRHIILNICNIKPAVSAGAMSSHHCTHGRFHGDRPTQHVALAAARITYTRNSAHKQIKFKKQNTLKYEWRRFSIMRKLIKFVACSFVVWGASKLDRLWDIRRMQVVTPIIGVVVRALYLHVCSRSVCCNALLACHHDCND